MSAELLAFMTWTAEMARMEGEGKSRSTTRAILEAAALQGDAKSKAKLVPPPFPEPLAYLWEWWMDLHAARPEGQQGIAPLTYGELHAWCQLTGSNPTPWEVSVLLHLDRTYRTTITETA